MPALNQARRGNPATLSVMRSFAVIVWHFGRKKYPDSRTLRHTWSHYQSVNHPVNKFFCCGDSERLRKK